MLFSAPARVSRLLALSTLTTCLVLGTTGCFGVQIKELKAQRNTAEARVMALRQDLDALRADHDRSSQRIRALEAEVAQREEALSAAQAELNATEARLRTANLALSSRENAMARELADRMNAALEAEEAARLEVERLEVALAQLELDRLAEEEELNSLRSRLTTRQAELDRSTAMITQLQQVIETQREASRVTQQSVEMLRSELEAQREQIAILRTQLTASEEAVVAASLTTQRLQEQLDAHAEALKIAQEEKRPAVSPQRISSLETAARSSIRGSGVTIHSNEEGITVRLPSDLLFVSGTTQLNGDALPTLQAISTLIRSERPMRVDIIGHTDNTPIRNMPYPDNWELASARANEVVRWLAAQQGTDRSRLRGISRSFFEPVGDNNTVEGRRANRRVEIRIVLATDT